MLKHKVTVGLCSLLLIISAQSSTAQERASDAAVQAGTQCGGQYECIETRPLSEAEARTSRGYPQPAESQALERTAATTERHVCEGCDKTVGR